MDHASELDTLRLPSRSEKIAAGNVICILAHCVKESRDSLRSENIETIQMLVNEYGGNREMFDQGIERVRDIIFSDNSLLQMVIERILRSKELLKSCLSAELMKRHQENPYLFKFPEEETGKVAEFLNLESAENWLMGMNQVESEEMARLHLGWSSFAHEGRVEMYTDLPAETSLQLEESCDGRAMRNLAEEKEVYHIAREHKPGSMWADCVFDELDEIKKRTRDTNPKVCVRFSTIAGISEQAKSLQNAWKLHNSCRNKKGVIQG